MLGFVGWRTGGPFRDSFQGSRELGGMRVPRRVRCLHAREEEKGPTGRAVSVARLDFVGRGNGDGMVCRGTGGSGGTVTVTNVQGMSCVVGLVGERWGCCGGRGLIVTDYWL